MASQLKPYHLQQPHTLCSIGRWFCSCFSLQKNSCGQIHVHADQYKTHGICNHHMIISIHICDHQYTDHMRSHEDWHRSHEHWYNQITWQITWPLVQITWHQCRLYDHLWQVQITWPTSHHHQMHYHLYTSHQPPPAKLSCAQAGLAMSKALNLFKFLERKASQWLCGKYLGM